MVKHLVLKWHVVASPIWEVMSLSLSGGDIELT